MASWILSLPFVFALSGTCLFADQVIIRNLAKPGEFEVDNTGPDISLRSRIVVQKHRDGVWSPVASEVQLAEVCAEDAPPKCRVLKAGEKIRPMPYNGFTCNSKCGPGCKGNAYVGPGEFRIVIFSCDEKQRFIGPAFRLGKY